MTRRVWSGSPDDLRHRFTDAAGREVPVRRWRGFGFFFKNSPLAETTEPDQTSGTAGDDPGARGEQSEDTQA